MEGLLRPGEGEAAMSTRDAPSFGALVRRFRRETGRTADDVAAAVGLTRRRLYELERDDAPPFSADLVVRLADALKLTPSDRTALAAAAQPGPTHVSSAEATSSPALEAVLPVHT